MWTCKDVGTAVFQGYAPQETQDHLVNVCPQHGQLVGSLPFTGMDLTILIVIAVVLLIAGFLLRRAGKAS